MFDVCAREKRSRRGTNARGATANLMTGSIRLRFNEWLKLELGFDVLTRRVSFEFSST